MKVFSPGLRTLRSSWKNDLRASVSVAFIAIPLGLGIAVASGVPPLAGIIPSVIGGLIISWISGTNMAVHSTPKMLIGVTAAAILTLGEGDMHAGYRLFLAAVVIAGAIQSVLGWLRMGLLGDLIPATVIKSLLSAVGIIIIFKELYVLLGAPTEAHSTLGHMAELFQNIRDLNPVIAAIGIGSTVIMFLHPKLNIPFLRAIPAAVWVIILSVAVSYAIDMDGGRTLNIFGSEVSYDSSALIHLPEDLRQGIVQPDFSMWASSTFWGIVITIILVSSIEGILSTKAVDRLDPKRRKSNVNREMSMMGLGTVMSGWVGGLPVIPGIVPSSVSVNHNGRSPLVGAIHAAIIVLLVLLLTDHLQHIPHAALAGILVHTGYKLANPSVLRDVYNLGWEQFIVFLLTLILTVMVNFMVGILGGFLAAIVFHTVHLRSVVKLFSILFRPNVVSYMEDDDETFYVGVKGYINFLNYPRLKNTLDLIPSDATINLDMSLAEFIDHTVMEHLSEYEENHIRKGGTFEILGLDTHITDADHPLATRLRTSNNEGKEKRGSTLTSRQLKLKELCEQNGWEFRPDIIRYPLVLDDFHFFRLRSVDRIYNQMIGKMENAELRILDADFHEGEFQTLIRYRTTAALITTDRDMPKFTLDKENFFDKLAAFVGYDDIDFEAFQDFSDKFRLKGENRKAIIRFFTPRMLELFEKHLSYNVESDGHRLLVIGRNRQMSEAEVKELIQFSVVLSEIVNTSHP